MSNSFSMRAVITAGASSEARRCIELEQNASLAYDPDFDAEHSRVARD